MSEPLAVGVDLGGTKIAFALVDRAGTPLLTYRLPTLATEGADAVFQRVAEGVQHLVAQTDRPIAGIGIGSPGHLNPHTGHIFKATNLAWDDINLIDGVRQHLALDVPLWLHKDANASALGELYFGAARGYSDFVLVTIGTGLGGSAVVAGQIIDGAHFSGMEIGHMPLDPNGRICICGMPGCPEMYVSGVGLLAGAREYLPQYPDSALATAPELTTEAILEAFKDGDPLATRLMEEATDWLSHVMIACMGIVDTGLFVIGGGLGLTAFDFFASSTREKIKRRTRRVIHQTVPIVASQVQHSAIGPACIVWHALGEL